ncbi:hypothetical protein [Ponticaulis sp.]|uniref:hypothetical protein n=1 Tax=Ponticaulis sp. TaxID=2020902 RepID=UPI000B6747DE|nr:hypothetical protein [Ponticaulis sp.]MAJ09236.1 hypothetical protein [Ponticaulis sp.]HBJ91320.1 hypothetical protein [Hyphomonadaceae bacterium]|tara:strand:- start:25945 stop:26235 length:291 start_codon:yes stop_codon:yes gene_type:complete
MSYQTYDIEWQGIRICIRYAPVKWNVISHIEIKAIEPARAPLPITPTGYLSHHIPIGSVEAEFDNVADCILSWLDERAQSAEWREHVEKSAQGELF